jgi:hypothetical protein
VLEEKDTVLARLYGMRLYGEAGELTSAQMDRTRTWGLERASEMADHPPTSV